jgi:hypothetical protein
MTRAMLVALMLIVILLALAPTGSADVHVVSQAGCAPDGVASGAIASRHAIDQGRPTAPIPVNASQGRTQGRGGAAPAQGTNC